MAEALGLAASVIAVVDVAAKTGSAYVRIQKLWSEVKSVPIMLQGKAEDIQIFEEYLANVEENLATSPLPKLASDRILLEKLIGRCRSALQDLKDIVDSIYTRVISERGLKHRIASAKAALKKGDLEALSLKFDRALQMFQMAQAEERRRMQVKLEKCPVTYLTISNHHHSAIATYNAIVESGTNPVLNSRNSTAAARIKAPMQMKRGVQEDDIRSRERQIVREFHSDPTELNIFGKFCFAYEQTGGFHAFFAAPSWLGLSVYSFLAQKAQMGWQVSLRAHEVVYEFDADLRGLIFRDNSIGLLKYLQDRRMGLFVRDSMGFGLLDTAVSMRSLNVTRALINNGLSIDTGDSISGWLLVQAIGLKYSDHKKCNANTPMIELLGENGLDDLLEADGLVWALNRGITLKGFYELLNRRIQGPTLSTEERLRCLRAIVYHDGGNWWTLDQIDAVVSKAALRDEAWFAHSRSPGNYSLLHSVAVGAVQPLLGDGCAAEQDAWARVLTDCVQLDPLGLQHADPDQPFQMPGWEANRRLWTPLAGIIYQACLKQRFSSLGRKPDFPLILERVLQFWVKVLASAGVDLLQYGRQERRFHQTEKAGKFRGFLSRAMPLNRHSDYGTVVIDRGACRYFIAGFAYGRLPEQWKLWITCENYDYAGDFWTMVDEQASSMPGSWVPDPVNREQENWQWMNRLSPPLIWSEYKRIRPPI